MKSGCAGPETKKKRSIQLPVLKISPPHKGDIQKSKTSRWRAAALVTLTLLMVAHFIQWQIMGTTISPIEPSESMYTLRDGAINAGFIFFTLAILSTLIFGRYVCGWGCHIVALQDLCAWLLRKIGLTPKPFRSRLLIFVPLIAALYMFVWPTVLRYLSLPKKEPLFPQFTNHLITTEFWATFPPFWVAVPFLFICGFATVYFLGQKGFCTYACPYGGIFVLADKVAPGKIRVTDDCNQCGLCTATCMANVQVHAEVAQYGMVVDPGCMKHMDCISVCPNDALYFGFGKPAIGVPAPSSPKKYSLTWPEEILAAAVFLVSFLAVWDVYLIVPMLMALGIASITTFLVMKIWRLFRTPDTSFYRVSLRSAGKFRFAGWAFLMFSLAWVGINAHSGWVRYHERAGTQAFQNIQIPEELALARPKPERWLSAVDNKSIVEVKKHLGMARQIGLLTNSDAISKLAWIEYLSGNTEQSIQLLGTAAQHQQGQGKALSFYYRGAMLNRLGRYDEALASLDQALAERSDLTLAHEEKGESLWHLGRAEEAVAEWGTAAGQNVRLPLSNNMLAGAASAMGKPEAAAAYEKQAEQFTPADPLFHWMLGLRLENVGMTALADKHFERAIQIDPRFRAARNPTEIKNR